MNAKSQRQSIDNELATSVANQGTASRVSQLRDVPLPSQAVAGLAAAQAVELDTDSGSVTLCFGASEAAARLHSRVEPVVIQRTNECGEFANAHPKPGGWLVRGVPTTRVTPGLDVGDEFLIEARRVTVRAKHELCLASGAARLALAAVDRIETIAMNTTSRTSVVHKIIGRAIQLAW